MSPRWRLAAPLIACLFTLVTVVPAAFAADLDNARLKLSAGDYAGVITALKDEKAPEARVILGRALLVTGDYEQALAVGKSIRSGAAAGEAAVIAARAETALGQYASAIKRMRAEIAARPTNYEARVVLSDALWTTGTPRRQLSEADAIADDWNEGKVTTAADLTWLGRALHLNEYFKDANEIFFDAREKDPGYIPAYVLHGRLFLEKADEKQAGEAMAAVLKRNPNHPEALTLSALMDLSSDSDTVKAAANIDAALKVNPRYVPAMQARARLLIEIEQFQEAADELKKALAINPKDPMTLSLMAGAHLLLEDDKGFKRWMKQALKVNARYAEGYHTVAEFAVRQHRYVDANKLEKKALDLDPDYAPSWVGLGIGMSRVGNDKLANEYLQKAFELDSFNVQAFNMTQGFYDGPVKDMEWTKSKRFRVRLHRSQAKVLSKVLPSFLETVFDAHKKKYHFTPETPIHVEVFPDDSVFAIRTTGYPQLSAHAVCFGRVITSRSPEKGSFNWAMVMWHELAHVWHIQMSKSRVPRWFTEGLAEHETTLARPEWKREMDSELYAAMSRGKLEGIAKFNTMFVHAKSIEDILVAYYYASKVVAFIEKKWGFDVFPKMLTQWGRRSDTETVFKKVLGLGLAEFDQQMKQYLETDLLARLKGEFVPDAKSKEPAQVAFAKAEAAIAKTDMKAAAEALDEALAAGAEGSLLRLMRGRIAMANGEWEAARTHLEKGVALDPERSELWVALTAVASEVQDEALGRKAVYNVARLEESDLAAALTAHLAALEAGDDARALHFGKQAVHIAPFNPDARLAEVRGLIETKQIKAAGAALDNVRDLLATPDGERRLTIAAARIKLAAGDEQGARNLLSSLKPGPDLDGLPGPSAPPTEAPPESK